MKRPRFTRREALQLFGANVALGLAGCSKPAEEVLPYVRIPEGTIPGEPLQFATALALNGFGHGVLVKSIDGRPIKIDGNPLHPASLGATNPFVEAMVLSLYDPDRSQTVTDRGHIGTMDALRTALLRRIVVHQSDGGAGLRLLSGRVTSPTLLRQIGEILDRYPQAAWHVHEPVDDEAGRQGTRLAFGRPLDAILRLEDAKVVVSLDHDLLGPGPDQVRNARQWSRSRQVDNAKNFSRLYAAQSTSTVTGLKADRALTAHPDVIANIAITIANSLDANLPAPELDPSVSAYAAEVVRDLTGNHDRTIVTAGPTQPPEVHALVHWINTKLNAPVTFHVPVDRVEGHEARSLADLAHDLHAGTIETLLVLDSNPAYDAPPDLNFEDALHRAAFSLHLGQYRDETAKVCHWHVPLSHSLESWSDLRARNGVASLVQPLINPLYGTVTAHELLAAWTGQDAAMAYDLVRQTWRRDHGDNFDAWWRTALRVGIIDGSSSKPVDVPQPRLPDIKPAQKPAGTSLVLTPDPSVWDGRFANNPWLQECPKPIGKQVWGNALAISSADAARLNVSTGDVLKVSANGRDIEVPVRVDSGTASGVVALSVGYGRRDAGMIGNKVGVNGFLLATSATTSVTCDVKLTRTGATQPLLSPQNDVRLDGDTRDLYRLLSLHDVSSSPGESVFTAPSQASLLAPPQDIGHAWGMVIDTSICVGCNACVIACQSENDIPVIGPEEIARGRDMHWLRVDHYDADDTVGGFQPVPCMHCEQAPCEPVCPVAASVHDSEGLNVQVYNRCVGTRFCEANCPYKVRRFNFFGYADGQEYANLGSESFKAQRNPDVTVRQRGVMEKCTYCVQRISKAHRTADREDRPIASGEIITACQAACPTQAITFGDLNNAASEVSRRKAQPHNYALLGHLGTRPRTTYLADIRNAPSTRGDRE